MAFIVLFAFRFGPNHAGLNVAGETKSKVLSQEMKTPTINDPWSRFQRSREHISEVPPPTAEDLEREKDPEGYECRERRRELRKLWKEEKPEFDRLERLAHALTVEKVIITSDSPGDDGGAYISKDVCDWDGNPEKHAVQWGLSKARGRSIAESRKDVIILVARDHDSIKPGRILAHEIGHHIEVLAGFSQKERLRSPFKYMRKFFALNSYFQNNCSEIRAESFAEYLTGSAIERHVERECETILSRLRNHNPRTAKLIEQYRATLGRRLCMTIADK